MISCLSRKRKASKQQQFCGQNDMIVVLLVFPSLPLSCRFYRQTVEVSPSNRPRVFQPTFVGWKKNSTDSPSNNNSLQMLGVPEIEQMAHMKTRFRKVGGLLKRRWGGYNHRKTNACPLNKKEPFQLERIVFQPSDGKRIVVGMLDVFDERNAETHTVELWTP